METRGPEHLRAVRDALSEAMSRQAWVTVFLQGDPARNVPVREYGGVPEGFLPAADGSERVILMIAEGQSGQLVRLDRIARVVFQRSESMISR